MAEQQFLYRIWSMNCTRWSMVCPEIQGTPISVMFLLGHQTLLTTRDLQRHQYKAHLTYTQSTIRKLRSKQYHVLNDNSGNFLETTLPPLGDLTQENFLNFINTFTLSPKCTKKKNPIECFLHDNLIIFYLIVLYRFDVLISISLQQLTYLIINLV